MLVAAYQMIMLGEKARTHRHTPNALRLIVDAAPVSPRSTASSRR
jgi:gentisate 1,2-dioxygenase